LMIGAEIVKDPKTKEFGETEAKDIMMKSFRRGLALITCGHSTLRIAPPLTITRDLVDPARTAGVILLQAVVGTAGIREHVEMILDIKNGASPVLDLHRKLKYGFEPVDIENRNQWGERMTS